MQSRVSIVFITTLSLLFCFSTHGALVTELLAIDKCGGAMTGGGPPVMTGGGPPPSTPSSTILDWVKVTYPDDVTSCKEVTFVNGSGHSVSDS